MTWYLWVICIIIYIALWALTAIILDKLSYNSDTYEIVFISMYWPVILIILLAILPFSLIRYIIEELK